MISITVSAMVLIYVISWWVNPASSQRKGNQHVLRNCHQKENVFLHLSTVPEGKQPSWSPHLHLVFCWGKNTSFTKELNIKWHFPVFTIWSFIELFSHKRINFVLCLTVIFCTFFDSWLYRCKYDCKMVTNMCKGRSLSWRWRTWTSALRVSVCFQLILCRSYICKACSNNLQSWKMWDASETDLNEFVQRIVTIMCEDTLHLPWLLRPIGLHRFLSILAWLSDPFFIFFNKPSLEEKCFHGCVRIGSMLCSFLS